MKSATVASHSSLLTLSDIRKYCINCTLHCVLLIRPKKLENCLLCDSLTYSTHIVRTRNTSHQNHTIFEDEYFSNPVLLRNYCTVTSKLKEEEMQKMPQIFTAVKYTYHC